MSQVRLTAEERIQAVERLGYGGREAHFLSLAALHGGYFLRRQYVQFLGKSVGGTAAALIERTLAQGHAQATTYAANTHIYHLCARPFYAALGQEDNRNRRTRAPATIRKKLMALDFVLAHPQHVYLATEQEKLDHFIGLLKLEQTQMPTRRYASGGKITDRYFVEKYPLFLRPSPPPARPPVPTFCFLDDGLASVSAFWAFLQDYAALWSQLPEFGVVYVAAAPASLEAATVAFERFTGRVLAAPMSPSGDGGMARLLGHFGARRLYETRQWESFDRAKLIRFRDESREFSGEKYGALYRQWKVGGAAAVEAFLHPRELSGPPVAHFETYKLGQNYDLFGTIRGPR